MGGKSKGKSIKLNLPLNFRKDVFFEQLPYLGHLEDPAIIDIVKNGIVDDLILQIYVLGTGFSKDSIQNSLDMIVSRYGKLSDATERRQFLSVTRESNSIDAVFKDNAKFDTQNSIIGMLLTKIEAGKLNQKNQIKKMMNRGNKSAS